MAKSQDKNQTKLPIPGFRSVSKEAVDRASAALAGGRQDPLTVPKNAAHSIDQKGVERWRWTETVLITDAYRSVTKKGLMDVTIKGKIRQSKTKDNTGKFVFSHFYMNMKDNISEAHVGMNDRSQGAINSFMIPLGLMPTSGSIKDTLLEQLFPPKGSPKANSPLLQKVVTVTICQSLEPKTDQNGKVVTDSDGDEILVKRDQMESALPPVKEEKQDEEEEEDDDDVTEDSDADDDSDESEEDESDDDESDEDDEEDEDEDEEEEPAPAPAPKSRRK